MILLALIAFAVKIAVPPGFMPCAGFMPTAMAPMDHGARAGMSREHRFCPFARQMRASPRLHCNCSPANSPAVQPDPFGALALVPAFDAATIVMAATVVPGPVVPIPTVAPGRGMAAPPPRSHAPPSSCA